MNYYIASCVFTSRFPELSKRIQSYITESQKMQIVRCCTPKYKLQIFEDQMPENYRSTWVSYKDTADWQAGDIAYSVCHNCNNIIEEVHEGVHAYSLWELILADQDFVYPDYQGRTMTIQDCWRSRDRKNEQDAVRSLLSKMNITVIEMEKNHAETRFCGNSLLRPQPPRNPVLAPRHYKEDIDGLFIPHTDEEQLQIMKQYCEQFTTDEVVCYCHYCLEGLQMGGKHGIHIAELLFPGK